MRPIRTTLASILALAFAVALIFGMSNDIFAQGYRNGADTCIARDDAPDNDGDGIPNGLDDDYVPPKDGTGNKYGKSRANRSTANTSLVRTEQGKKMFRGSFRSASWSRLRTGKITPQNAAPALNSGRNLKPNTWRALTGTCDGARKQVRHRSR